MIVSIFEFWWMFLVVIGIAAISLFKPYLKGKIGEFAVTRHVSRYLNTPDYILMNDLTLADTQGGSTQIDHVLLSPFGIFVIETKNYKGWIFGSARQKTWTQKIYQQSYKFQNPIHQNYKHVKVLEALLADIIEADVLHSVVVFMPEAEFKTQLPENVFRGADWTNYVLCFKDEKISALKLKQIQLRLDKHALDQGWKTNKAHVEHLKQRKNPPAA